MIELIELCFLYFGRVAISFATTLESLALTGTFFTSFWQKVWSLEQTLNELHQSFALETSCYLLADISREIFKHFHTEFFTTFHSIIPTLLLILKLSHLCFPRLASDVDELLRNFLWEQWVCQDCRCDKNICDFVIHLFGCFRCQHQFFLLPLMMSFV